MNIWIIVCDLAMALAEMHRIGLMHGELKASFNI
jgi:hypothetical protein